MEVSKVSPNSDAWLAGAWRIMNLSVNQKMIIMICFKMLSVKIRINFTGIIRGQAAVELRVALQHFDPEIFENQQNFRFKMSKFQPSIISF
jgi:hypothetical protein